MSEKKLYPKIKAAVLPDYVKTADDLIDLMFKAAMKKPKQMNNEFYRYNNELFNKIRKKHGTDV
jgi:hypothetical protein